MESEGGVRYEQLAEAARQLWEKGRTYPVWVLEGQMGAGKTTLVRALCEVAGVEGPVSSPTFALVNEYRDPHGEPVYHFDFFRLQRETEAFDAGFEEYLASGRWCLLEWADRVPSLLPKSYFKVRLVQVGDSGRKIFYSYPKP